MEKFLLDYINESEEMNSKMKKFLLDSRNESEKVCSKMKKFLLDYINKSEEMWSEIKKSLLEETFSKMKKFLLRSINESDEMKPFLGKGHVIIDNGYEKNSFTVTITNDILEAVVITIAFVTDNWRNIEGITYNDNYDYACNPKVVEFFFTAEPRKLKESLEFLPNGEMAPNTFFRDELPEYSVSNTGFSDVIVEIIRIIKIIRLSKK